MIHQVFKIRNPSQSSNPLMHNLFDETEGELHRLDVGRLPDGENRNAISELAIDLEAKAPAPNDFDSTR
jgi:hypothetical protein